MCTQKEEYNLLPFSDPSAFLSIKTARRIYSEVSDMLLTPCGQGIVSMTGALTLLKTRKYCLSKSSVLHTSVLVAMVYRLVQTKLNRAEMFSGQFHYHIRHRVQ